MGTPREWDSIVQEEEPNKNTRLAQKMSSAQLNSTETFGCLSNTDIWGTSQNPILKENEIDNPLNKIDHQYCI
jgi:hypothetical protein